MNRKYLRLTRPFAQTFIPSSVSTILKVNWESQPCKRWAGHSKWQNIKSTKSAADQNKSIIFQRLCHLIQLAVKRNGPDASNNPKLKGLLEEAKKINMPKATIEKAMKQIQVLDKPYWTVFSGPKGVIVGFQVIFPNTKPTYLLSKLGPQTKKIKLKLEPHFTHLCNERGIIITDSLENGYERAMEDAIEIGIEEVHENEDKTLIFECSPDRIESYSQQLEKKGYNIHSADTELEFKDFISLEEEEVRDMEKVISNLQNQYEEVIRASYNYIETQ